MSLRLLTALPLAAAVLVPCTATAQSAADKATARELAIAGIEDYEAKKYKSGLDKLQKAQALYDAHMHLLYIARCQAELGELVEAAETYRSLARKPTPKDSDVIRQAQIDGANELAALEPRIPVLRIDVVPAGIEGLQLSINDTQVSSASIGIDRPANPGKNDVAVWAPGYKVAKASVTLEEGKQGGVTLKLQKGKSDPLFPVDGVVGMEGEGGEGGAGTGGGGGASPTPPPPKPVSFVIEPRLSVIAPYGKIGDHAANKVVRGGAGGELRFGVHFAKLRRYTAFAIVEGHGIAPISGFEKYAFAAFDDPDTPEDESNAIESGNTSTVLRAAGGVGFQYSTPHHQLGYFAELDLMLEHMAGSTKLEVDEDNVDANGSTDCKTDVSFTGPGVRLSGGGVIPLGRLAALTPYASFGISSYPKAQLRGDCEKESKEDLGTVHGWMGIGVGMQFLLGE